MIIKNKYLVILVEIIKKHKTILLKLLKTILIILSFLCINFVLYWIAAFCTIQLAKTTYEETGIIPGSWESNHSVGKIAIVFMCILTVINLGLIIYGAYKIYKAFFIKNKNTNLQYLDFPKDN